MLDKQKILELFKPGALLIGTNKQVILISISEDFRFIEESDEEIEYSFDCVYHSDKLIFGELRIRMWPGLINAKGIFKDHSINEAYLIKPTAGNRHKIAYMLIEDIQDA